VEKHFKIITITKSSSVCNGNLNSLFGAYYSVWCRVLVSFIHSRLHRTFTDTVRSQQKLVESADASEHSNTDVSLVGLNFVLFCE